MKKFIEDFKYLIRIIYETLTHSNDKLSLIDEQIIPTIIAD